MNKKLVARSIRCVVATFVVLLLGHVIASAKVLGLTLPGVALVLFGFAVFYMIKAIRRPEGTRR